MSMIEKHQDCFLLGVVTLGAETWAFVDIYMQLTSDACTHPHDPSNNIPCLAWNDSGQVDRRPAKAASSGSALLVSFWASGFGSESPEVEDLKFSSGGPAGRRQVRCASTKTFALPCMCLV